MTTISEIEKVVNQRNSDILSDIEFSVFKKSTIERISYSTGGQFSVIKFKSGHAFHWPCKQSDYEKIVDNWLNGKSTVLFIGNVGRFPNVMKAMEKHSKTCVIKKSKRKAELPLSKKGKEKEEF